MIGHHHSVDNYQLLAKDDIRAISKALQKKIIRLHVPTFYNTFLSITSLNFADYHFDQLREITLGYSSLVRILSFEFKSTLYDYSM